MSSSSDVSRGSTGSSGSSADWVVDAPGVVVGLGSGDDAGVLRVRFDRPATLNAVDGPILDACSTTLERARGRDDVRVVVLTGTGRAFSTGATLGGDDPLATFDVSAMDRANRLVRAVTDLDKPVVAAVNGVAAGFGMAVALAADLQVVSSEASFALTFTRIGLMPDGGTTATVAASVGRARAMRMALLGERLGAAEAHEAGLVSHLVPAEAYDDAVADLVRSLAHGAPLAFAATKKAVNAATLVQLDDALGRERLGQVALFSTDDVREGMTAFVEKRRARFSGS